jgi:hypothetical protein
MAPFAVGVKVQRVFANELKSVSIDSLDDGVDPNTLKGALFQLLASEQVEQAVFDLFKYCLYNDAKVDRGTFEAAEARQDYLPAAWEAVSFNLSPFLKSLGSLLSGLAGQTTNIRK